MLHKNHNIMISSVFEHKEWLDVVVTIVGWLTMALVVFFQEDGDVQCVYRNLKIFCETGPWCSLVPDTPSNNDLTAEDIYDNIYQISVSFITTVKL